MAIVGGITTVRISTFAGPRDLNNIAGYRCNLQRDRRHSLLPLW
jgi:hypothetical protein